jgi:hypothetical protein
MTDYLMLLPCIGLLGLCALGARGESASQPPVLGLTGTVSDVAVAVAAAGEVQPLAESAIPVDVNLHRMAEWSLEYLIHSPRPEMN